MKTKRPKLPMPRRRLALLWLLAPCLVLLASYVTDAYRFTPDQVQRMEEKRRCWSLWRSSGRQMPPGNRRSPP